jgi:tetratricopeptide (TPR) repeat protein
MRPWILLAALALACARAEPPSASADAAPRGKAEQEAEERTFAHQLGVVDATLASQLARAERSDNSSLLLGQVASTYMGRARLTGDYRDYASAEAWLERAFAVHADRGFGPWMTRAQLNYTLHRLDRIEADFAAANRLPPEGPQAIAARLTFAGNIAFQRGQYQRALELYEKSVATHEGMSNLAALAQYRWKTGAFDEAEALYAKAESTYHNEPTEPHAWLHLMRGLMDLDRGRYEDALADYRAAEQWIVGYWLIDEHIAEVLHLTGETERAKALYADILRRTNNPEFRDAMAGILREQGAHDEARAQIALARARYEELLAMFPEAAYGHALEHFLEFGEPARARELAEKNHALRPNAEAKILLAKAQLAAGETERALATIEQALATPWNTADLHATAAAVYRAVGQVPRADAELAKAQAIDPHAQE